MRGHILRFNFNRPPDKYNEIPAETGRISVLMGLNEYYDNPGAPIPARGRGVYFDNETEDLMVL